MKRAFTLVELLVVIAIIATLLLMMSPTISSMLMRVKQNICENNHHQIVIALTQYQATYNAYMCWPNWLAPETQNKWNGPGWLYDYDRTSANWTAEARTYGALWPYIKEEPIYRCPLDVGPYTGSNKITSYLMNGAVIHYGDKWLDNPPNGPLFRVTEMNPMSVIFWEAEEDPNWPGADWNDGSSYPGEGLTQRHRDGATFGCADGHTEYMTRAQFVAETAKKPSLLWCSPLYGNF